MKTSFKIAWVDDNLTDPAMDLSSQLSRKLKRKNGFSLVVNDIYAEVTDGDFDALLSNLAATIDLSNSVDLVVVDYQLGNNVTGERIAKKFREKLPSTDILFYSGKESADKLRLLIAQENADGISCVGRQDLVEGAYTVIENIINRSHKISTLRGLILNSVCEMDQMIVDIICKYGATNTIKEQEIKNKVVQLIRPRNNTAKTRLQAESIRELLTHKAMMSGNLFTVLELIKGKLGLAPEQLELLDLYRLKVLQLRNSAAHAKEGTCQTTGQSMLKFKDVEYKRDGIDIICKTIVSHENNIQSILDGIA
jgi:hypothetical protein